MQWSTSLLLLPFLLLFAVSTAAQPVPELEGDPAPSNVRGKAYPRIHPDLRVTFRVTAPNAREVLVAPRGGDSGLGPRPYPMTRGRDGVWYVVTPPVRPGFHYYELVIDGFHCPDPNSETYFGWAQQTSGLEVPDPTLDFYEAKKVPHGEVRAVWYHSSVTGKVRRAYVYTPPGYDSGRKRYPVLYLQHGAGESERGWSSQGRANFILDNLIAAGQAVPMLVVMDNGYADLPPGTPQGAGGQNANPFGRVVLEDLIPTIDREFRTVADAEHRAIAGLSMGGGQALSIGLEHLDKFHWIGVFSGAIRSPNTTSGPLANAQEANRKIRLLWIGCGTGDGLYRASEGAHSALTLAGIHHRWFSGPGAHEWQVWRKHLHAFAPLLFRPASSTASVVGLETEYLAQPLGIDVEHPRLSWKLEAANPDARGLRQTGYRVLVAGNRTLLNQDKGNFWDSGEVASERSHLVEYAGRPLASGMECWWKVQVRDERGRMTPWSEPARWTMGLLKPGDWKASWIGAGATKQDLSAWNAENTLPDPWLRKTFLLPVKPIHAVIYVASIGYHELYVNGRKVGDGLLAPSVTDHSKRARYVTYEITDYLLPGQNAIGLWLGVSWSIYPPYHRDDRPPMPMALAQAKVILPDGNSQEILTDSTWKTHPSPNRLLGKWDFMHFGGELYDARAEDPDWCDPWLDESDWKQAAIYTPHLALSAEILEPNRRIEALRPIAIEALSDGEYRVDMGRNFAGMVEIDVSGAPGTQVDFHFSERSDRETTHGLHSAYVIGPTGKGTFRNRFNYSVGRWIRIGKLGAPPTPEQVRGYLVRTDYRRGAQFECSDKLLNDIYHTTLWTFENLSLGGYVVDCPHRERMGYGGDAHSTTGAALSNYHLGAFYTKWAQDWRDVQDRAPMWGVGIPPGKPGSGQPDPGNLPYTAPTYWGGGGPIWSGYCVTLPWLVYRQYGDVRILEEGFPTIQRWLAFLESKSKNDILPRFGGDWDFLGDWLWPGAKGTPGDTPETLFFNNCYWIYNLQTAARIAEALGKSEEASAYRKRAEKIRGAVHGRFYHAQDGNYVNGSQTYLAVALFVGLPPEDLRSTVWKRLEEQIRVQDKGHIHAGITGLYFVLKTLENQDRQDLILAMALKEDFPSWGDMLRRGATTLWESWEGNQSLLHSSYIGIGMWFIDGLAGIQLDPDNPGFRSFVIKPGVLPGGPTWVRSRYESPYGAIASEWKVEQGVLEVNVTVPPNSTAKLYLPVADAGTVSEGGRKATAAPGVRTLGKEAAGTAFRLESGTYVFSAKLPASSAL